MAERRSLDNILLVDDDPITNYLSRALLGSLSYGSQIDVARNGKEALDLLTEHQSDPAHPLPDLIFLDINMPVMDGFEFLDHFRQFHAGKEIIVVILTTSDNEKDVQNAQKYRVHGYLNKPLSKDKIRAVVSQYFEV